MSGIWEMTPYLGPPPVPLSCIMPDGLVRWHRRATTVSGRNATRTDRRHISLGSPASVQDGSAPVRSCRVDSHFRYSEWSSSTDEDIPSTISLAGIGTLGAHEGIYILRIIHRRRRRNSRQEA